MIPQLRAEINTSSRIIVNGGGQYQPFTKILSTDYRFSSDLTIKLNTHVLPASHRLFRILTARQLIAIELLGHPPLTRTNCCGRAWPRVPNGDSVDTLRYEAHPEMLLHRRACLRGLVSERPNACGCVDHGEHPIECRHEWYPPRPAQRMLDYPSTTRKPPKSRSTDELGLPFLTKQTKLWT